MLIIASASLAAAGFFDEEGEEEPANHDMREEMCSVQRLGIFVCWKSVVVGRIAAFLRKKRARPS